MAENTVETISLRALVGHREFVRASDPLEIVQARFAAGRQDFLAVLEGRTLVGLCSRRDVGMLLGARYGFALHGRAPVAGHLSAHALTVAVTEPLTAVLQAVAARRDEHFYDDVLLVDGAGDFLGLIHVRDLVRLQTSLLMGNLDELAARNRQMEDDLRMAREVQLALLPRDFPVCRAPDGFALDFARRYAPAGGVSGDCFDVIPLGPTAAGLLVCDVMGHGVRSALVTAMVRTVVEELRGRAGDAAALLTEVNAHLSRLLQRAGDLIFVTAAYAVVDAVSRRLTYAQAGHPAPLLLRAGAGAAVALSGAEAVGGPALGLVDDAVYEAVTLELGRATGCCCSRTASSRWRTRPGRNSAGTGWRRPLPRRAGWSWTRRLGRSPPRRRTSPAVSPLRTTSVWWAAVCAPEPPCAGASVVY